MFDFALLSTATYEICVSKPRISCRINRRPPNSRSLDPVASGMIRIWSLRATDRDEFKAPSSRKGLIGPSSFDIGGSSSDKETKKYKPPDEFVEISSSDGDATRLAPESGNEEERVGFETATPSSFDFLELKRELEKEEEMVSDKRGVEEDLIPPGGRGSTELESADEGRLVSQVGVKGRRQIMKRSNLLAKQVISIESAQSLGFVSQLWVDTRLWMVVLVEVRPNFLSGEMEKFLLEDVRQVGDVVLVEDESVMENELKMTGLETLVGYNVVTSGRHDVGKVRGYTFNINSGAVESLELDSFGWSIIPSSLVSTYCLLIDDVLEVVSDTVVVHQDAISRVQRLTKRKICNLIANELYGDEISSRLQQRVHELEDELHESREKLKVQEEKSYHDHCSSKMISPEEQLSTANEKLCNAETEIADLKEKLEGTNASSGTKAIELNLEKKKVFDLEEHCVMLQNKVLGLVKETEDPRGAAEIAAKQYMVELLNRAFKIEECKQELINAREKFDEEKSSLEAGILDLEVVNLELKAEAEKKLQEKSILEAHIFEQENVIQELQASTTSSVDKISREKPSLEAEVLTLSQSNAFLEAKVVIAESSDEAARG
ncbi:PRC-barrel domain [Musa troglodytarum]|uniref:PRC-barrel domain n=1 Tax=Musa troglodytarum TaxID=320322 RepID=A0A9E7H7T0_9LILI|nr:PRC-barrel domain [Musa troglodytarum]